MRKAGINPPALGWDWRRTWELVVLRCVCVHIISFFFFENIYIREYVLYIYSLGTARLKQIKDVSPLPGSWGGGWGFFNFLKQALHPQWEWGGRI